MAPGRLRLCLRRLGVRRLCLADLLGFGWLLHDGRGSQDGEGDPDRRHDQAGPDEPGDPVAARERLRSPLAGGEQVARPRGR